MGSDFIPASDGGLLNFANNYSTLVTANAVSYGLTSAIATTLAAKYDLFATNLAAATAAATRGGSTVKAKDLSRDDLVNFIRQTARTIQGTPTVSDQQKYDLGLSVRGPVSPINPPTAAPVVEVISVKGKIVKIALRSSGSDRRGKPDGCSTAYIFTHVGTTPPADLPAYDFQGGTTRTNFTLEFTSDVPAGSQVWITACWVSPRSQNGPACEPITTYLGGGVAAAGA